MKAIVLVTQHRSHYVEKTLIALAENRLDGWTLYVGMEPLFPAVEALIASVKFIPKVVFRNAYQLGVRLNNFVTISKAIMDGAESILYLEDDVLLSPDAVDLANWYLDRKVQFSDPKHVGLGLQSLPSDPTKPAALTQEKSAQGLLGWGFCCTAEQWHRFYKRYWFWVEPWMGGDAWDWAVGGMIDKLGLTVVRPQLSRSQHIGSWGVSAQELIPHPKNFSHQRITDFQLED